MNRRFLPLIIGSLLLPLGCGGDATDPFPTLVATTTSLPNGAPSVAYSETLTATGGDGSYTWSLTVGSLPTGLSLNTSTGDITGTPTGSSSTFTVQVASGDSQTATQPLTILINATLTVTTSSLSNGATTVAYSETLAATGGDGNYTWSVTVGSLPPGLSLDMSTGTISGTPTGASGTFTVQVASGDGQTAQQALSITVITGGGPPVLTTSVNVVDFDFDPPDIQVTGGATVTWTWTGAIGHNVTFASGTVSAPSATQAAGTFQVTMPTATGTYDYQCTIHPTLMNGTVTVQ